jgi:hypothetical protein
MSQYIGQSPDSESVRHNRFFYGIRRDDDGNLYLARFDSQSGTDTLVINNPGDAVDNWEDFEIGIDFFEGRGLDHELTYANINYEQYRWDDRMLSYYLNSDGELVLKFGNRSYPLDV